MVNQKSMKSMKLFTLEKFRVYGMHIYYVSGCYMCAKLTHYISIPFKAIYRCTWWQEFAAYVPK